MDAAKPSRGVGDLGFATSDIVFDGDDDYPIGSDAEAADVARGAPSLREIIVAAHRAAGIAPASDPTRSWQARSRWSALIPLVSFRVGNSSSWRDVDDPTLLTINHGASFTIGASWRLDELVFDPNEPRFDSYEVSLRRERRKLASIATHLYFRWLRAAGAARASATSASAGPAGHFALRAAELEAQLDALTAGWFSDQRTLPNR